MSKHTPFDEMVKRRDSGFSTSGNVETTKGTAQIVRPATATFLEIGREVESRFSDGSTISGKSPGASYLVLKKNNGTIFLAGELSVGDAIVNDG